MDSYLKTLPEDNQRLVFRNLVIATLGEFASGRSETPPERSPTEQSDILVSSPMFLRGCGNFFETSCGLFSLESVCFFYGFLLLSSLWKNFLPPFLARKQLRCLELQLKP